METISKDYKNNNEKLIAFYVGEGSLNSNCLHSNKGEKSYVKPGMICDASIITRKEKMLYYLLEKIGLKNI
ncbi:hypothetical protein ACSXBY_15545 (plasmid) [Clostridium perfringens]|uniref:hypothetical protein n=1 Tax=Clostridium perfringens TaxID=1502 RepID=UPI00016BC3EC|nr:hypothetical protein [Clostridium perfringens]